MSVLVIGDTHIWNHKWQGGPLVDGINQRCRDILESILNTVHTAVKDYGVTTVVQLGDFFDGPKPSAAVLDAAIRMIEESGVTWHIIAGNHDIASYDAPTAVAPLGHVENVYVYERPTQVVIEGFTWAMVPYMGPNADAALTNAAHVLNTSSYAAVHYGLTWEAERRPDTLAVGNWVAAVRKNHTVAYGFFGHEHTSRARSGYGISLGAYTNSNFSDVDCTPTVAIVEGSNSVTYRAYGPRFVSCDTDELDLPSLLNSQHIRGHVLGFPTYLYINKNKEQAAQVLLEAGVIQGYKVKTTPLAEQPDATVTNSADACAPMDVVYATAGSLVAAEHLEAVVAILEQDMQE